MSHNIEMHHHDVMKCYDVMRLSRHDDNRVTTDHDIMSDDVMRGTAVTRRIGVGAPIPKRINSGDDLCQIGRI